MATALDTISPVISEHAGKLLGLAGAGGLLGGYLSSQEKGSPHETPADRRKRILKNALGYALATGGIATTGLAAGTLLSSNEGTEGGPSPWKNLIGRGLTAAGVGVLHKSLVQDKFMRPKNDHALTQALEMLGSPLSKTPPAAGTGPHAPMTPAELRLMTPAQVAAVSNGTISGDQLIRLNSLLREGGAKNIGLSGLRDAKWGGSPPPIPGPSAPLKGNYTPIDPKAYSGANIRNIASDAKRGGSAAWNSRAGYAARRNWAPGLAGTAVALAPQLAELAGSILGTTSKD